ncbi:glycosyltransferase [candidate division KSB1 bacterium]|nr:glycosyltransferase [candidate division KSB1 bacterium]
MERIKNIAYILYWNDSVESGVIKKVISIILTWKSQQIDVHIFLLTKNPGLARDLSQKLGTDIKVHRFSFANFGEKLASFRNMIKRIIDLNPSFVYFRYQHFLPGFLKLSRRIKIFVEINGNDLIEIRKRSWFKYVILKQTRKLIFNHAAGLIFVTHELSGHPNFVQLKAPRLVLANGISLKSYPMVTHEFVHKEPILLFIGSEGQNWHGVDKILQMAEIFKDWLFYIIGTEKSHEKILPNVSFTGFLKKDDYSHIMCKADIGIGSLALHRKEMNEACTLKVREYLAYGLPIIIGYRDTDFMDGAPFILELENSENNVVNSISLIEQFVQKWKGKKVPRSKVDKIDIYAKEQQRLNFMVKNIV